MWALDYKHGDLEVRYVDLWQDKGVLSVQVFNFGHVIAVNLGDHLIGGHHSKKQKMGCHSDELMVEYVDDELEKLRKNIEYSFR